MLLNHASLPLAPLASDCDSLSDEMRALRDLVRSHHNNRTTSSFLDLSTYCGQVTDGTLELVSTYSSLRGLDLFCCDEITDAGLKSLSCLTSLTWLNIGFCRRVTDVGLSHLIGLPYLSFLAIDACPLVTDVGLSHIATLPNITDLSLSCVRKATDVGIKSLSSNTSITALSLGHCVLTDASLLFFISMRNLRSLDLIDCDSLQHFNVDLLDRLRRDGCKVNYRIAR